MEGFLLGPGGEDITLPDQVAPRGRKASSTRKIKPQTSNVSVNHIPSIPVPHGLEYPLGSRMHLGVVHRRLEARGRPFPRSPRSRSRVNLPVIRPLTRGPQGQPSPLRTPHGRPGVQGIFSTSRGQAPHGWPIVHHSMATGLPDPTGLLHGAFGLPIPFPVPLCHIGRGREGSEQC